MYDERLGIVGFPTTREGGVDSDDARARGERAGDVRSADTVLLMLMAVMAVETKSC